MTLEVETGQFVQANGLKIHYHALGEGKPVILLHGGGSGVVGWSNYSRNIEPLARKFRTIVIDLPGFGKSDKTASQGSVFEFMSDAVIGVMDALKIDKASFIGNSLGGGTSLKTCVRHPARVDRMVLMGPAGSLPMFTMLPEGMRLLRSYYSGSGPSLEKLKTFLEFLVFDPSQISEELLQSRFELSCDPQVVANPPMKNMGKQLPADQLWRDTLSALPHKTLLVFGREDRTVPLDAAFILLRTLPNASLHVMPNTGHWAQWERADEFNQLCENFLA